MARANALAGRWPRWMQQGSAALLRAYGGRRARMLGAQLTLPFPEAVVMNSAYLSPTLVERLTGSGPQDIVGARVAEAEAMSVPGDAASSISRYDQRTYLPCLLDRMDRMTMASGLEGRVPFLDVELAEWASRLPGRYRLGLFGNKRVVKRLAERHLSRAVTHGPKSGFGVPVGDWLRTPGWADIIDRLRNPGHPASSMVDGAEVRRMVAAHLDGQPGFADALWLLANLYLWHEISFDD